MKRIFLLLLALLPLTAEAASPIIYQGTNSKDLTSGGLITKGLKVGNSGTQFTVAGTGAVVSASGIQGTSVTTTTGNITSGLNLLGRNLYLTDVFDGFNVGVQSPSAGMTASYNVTLPPVQGTVGQTFQNDGSGNLSWVSPVTAAPTAYSQAPVAVTAVGGSFPPLGHVLDAKDFTAPASNQFTFYNLAANANDGSTQAINLTANGTPTYTTTNVLGTANAAATLNGTTQYYSSSNVFFSPGNGKSWAVGGWFNATSWAGSGGLFTVGSSFSTDRVIGVSLGSGSLSCNATNTASIWDAGVNVTAPASGWHHVACVYSFSGSLLQLYVDGKLAGTAPLANTRSATTPTFLVGQYFGTFLAGSAEDVFFVNNYATTADDIRKLAARRIDHNKNIATNNQLWTANWGRSDSTVATQLDASWLVSKSSTSLWADFSGVATGAFVDLSVQNIGQYGTALVPNSTYDSGVLSATPATTIAHGLGARPANIVYEYETTTGHFTPLTGSNFCEADATSLYCDWTGLSVSASNRIEILAGGTPLISAIPLADATTNGIVSTSTQTLAGDKTLTGSTTIGGTTASQTTTIQSGGSTIAQIKSAATSATYLRFNQASSALGFLGLDYGNEILSGSANGDLVLSSNNKTLWFANGASANTKVGSVDNAGTWTFNGNIKAQNSSGGASITNPSRTVAANGGTADCDTGVAGSDALVILTVAKNGGDTASLWQKRNTTLTAIGSTALPSSMTLSVVAGAAGTGSAVRITNSDVSNGASFTCVVLGAF
jgi:hypothetical protein